MENLRDVFNSYKVETVPAKNLVIDIDGIECYGLWGSVEKISFQGKIIYKGIGESIFVDKNHDLSFYAEGDDYINRNFFNPNSTVIFGYEWGGYGEKTRIQNTCVGAGFSNTNSLIYENLNTLSSGWDTIWKRIEIFRRSHSDRWFLPSQDELNLIYEAIDNVDNLSTLMNQYYWSSSEESNDHAWGQDFSTGRQGNYGKYYHFVRSRLCIQY